MVFTQKDLEESIKTLKEEIKRRKKTWVKEIKIAKSRQSTEKRLHYHVFIDNTFAFGVWYNIDKNFMGVSLFNPINHSGRDMVDGEKTWETWNLMLLSMIANSNPA